MTRVSGQVSGVSAPQARAAAPEPWAAGARELRAAGGALGATANGAGVGGRGAPHLASTERPTALRSRSPLPWSRSDHRHSDHRHSVKGLLGAVESGSAGFPSLDLL